jgi:hypothetical protein
VYLHNNFPTLMILRLKFFYLQLEENVHETFKFLMKEFPAKYMPTALPKAIKSSDYQIKRENVAKLDSLSGWKSPFGIEVRHLDKLNSLDLVLELVNMRKKINEYQRIYCLYSKCLGSMNKTRSSGDVE